MACEHCPCPDVCLARPEWCRWAASESPDPIAIRSICERSRIEHAGRAYPPLREQAGNLMGTVGRIVAAVARGDPVWAPAEVIGRRRAICEACEFFDHSQARCRKCGCTGLKLDLATERCPLEPPKW